MQSFYTGTKEITLRAPAGGVIKDKFVAMGAFFGAAMSTVPAGKLFDLNREDIFAVEVESVGDAIAPGDYIYWNAGRADAEFHNDAAAAGARLVGIAMGNVEEGETDTIEVAIERNMPETVGAGVPAAEAVEFVDGYAVDPNSQAAQNAGA